MTAIGKIYEVRRGCSLRLPPHYGQREGDPSCLWAMPGETVIIRHPLEIVWLKGQMDKLIERKGMVDNGSKPVEIRNMGAQKAMRDYDAKEAGAKPETVAQVEATGAAGAGESAPSLVDEGEVELFDDEPEESETA